MRYPRATRSAFTLLELLIVIGITALLTSLLTVAFADVIRLHGAYGRYQERLQAAKYLLRRVARDVRAGVALPSEHGPYRAGPTTLLIRTEDALIVYEATPSGVDRYRVESGTRARRRLVPARGLEVSFTREPRSVVATAAWREPDKIGLARPVLSRRTTLRNGGTP
jgi:prepilin-type N-terminal cleavage/methylation domain-containing protein